MHALLHIKRMVYQEAYRDWLEGGLRLARSHKGRSEEEMERVIRAALSKYGNFVEATRAGAL